MSKAAEFLGNLSSVGLIDRRKIAFHRSKKTDWLKSNITRDIRAVDCTPDPKPDYCSTECYDKDYGSL